MKTSKMRKIILLLFFVINAFGQEITSTDSIKKSNPIIFTEFLFGGSGGSSKGFTFGGELNYQEKDNLFTYRYFNLSNSKTNWFFIIPFFENIETVTENAFLYGKRYVYSNYSLSYSAGISLLNKDYYSIGSSNNIIDNQKSVGFPFEVNIKWYKPEKSRFRAYYGLIPIGKKKVSFGRSFGFKFYGDISKNTFIGLGITYGLGWHKNY